MKINTNALLKKVENVFNQKKFYEIIALLTDEVLVKQKNAELYVLRGNTCYNIKEYNNAIEDYSKAIDINPNSEIAFYNRGLALFANKEYDNAIADYTKAIDLTSDYADAYYNNRGNAWKANGKFIEAIDDYTEAIKINPAYENAYYSRGLTKKENNIDLKGSKQDFEEYLKLTIDVNDPWAKYAKYYIKKLDEINDNDLTVIANLISNIKSILLLDEECITHYTSLSVLKSLILDCSKFRISEGNFMNDPSEGIEFFDFLYDNTSTFSKNGSSIESFSPKPFIGSFVTEDKYDDLNMWRFYGKEKGEEAKGCAITIRKQKFIDDIKESLSNEKNKKARLDDESDINFYRVVYVIHNGNTKFYIPNSDKSEELERLMKELNTKIEPYVKIEPYKGNNRVFLEKYLNSIAFLFKNDAYKNEDEVRLVMNGIEFEKKYNMGVCSPRVYIELVPIKDIVSQIILGPKVDKGSEWIAAFHYRYEKSVPEIKFSHLPYK